MSPETHFLPHFLPHFLRLLDGSYTLTHAVLQFEAGRSHTHVT